MFNEILKYHETPQDSDFVIEVMKRIQHQQRVRRLILTVTGIAGGAFGAYGVLKLSNSLGQLITEANVLPVSVALIGTAVFLAWLFRDEMSATG
jgi:formate-dependent nitrite reductase membrane component NrfD